MLKITDVLLKSLPLTKDGCDVIKPILKIKVGDKNVKTSRYLVFIQICLQNQTVDDNGKFAY